MAPKAMFLDKDPATRKQGIMSKQGDRDFERARGQLKAIYRDATGAIWTGAVSDGDIFEFLARGVESTRAYLKKQAGK